MSEESLCWYSASSTLDHHHSPGKHTGTFLYSDKNHIWTYPTVMHLLFLFGSVAFEGFISHPHSRGVRQIFATSVHINLTSCPPLFFQLPPTAALSVFSTYRTSHGARLFVTGAVQERCCVLICSGDDSSLDEIKWAVGCLCLSLSHSVG